MKQRILTIGAHPDDADFGTAGTMQKFAREGYEIYYLICTNGDKGGARNSHTPGDLVRIRRREQKNAASMVNAREVFFLNNSDGELVPDKNLKREIVRVIRKVKPDKVFSFDPANLTFESFYLFHTDHRAVAVSVFDSIYPAAKNIMYFPELLDEGLEPHKVKELFTYGTHKPNIWFDISADMDKKLEMIKCHASQFQAKRFEEVRKHIYDIAREAGAHKGYGLAEAFRVITFPF
ncbi:MAG: PIG-L deacetylase family protein [Vulcanimicrobiota bacterium]